MEILKIYTRRSHYSAEEAAENSLTVGELKQLLEMEDLDDNTRIVTCSTNDFCKYGFLSRNSFDIDSI